MLLNTESSFSKDDIITLKNSLGEEIISKYVEEDATHYTLHHPVALGMGEQGMQFMPPVISGDLTGNVRFPKSHVMWIVESIPEIQTQYSSQTSGIALPNAAAKKIII